MMRYLIAVRGESIDATSSMGVVKEKMIDIFNEEQLQECDSHMRHLVT